MRRYIVPCGLSFSFSQTPKSFFVEEITTLTPTKRGRYGVVRVRKRGLTTWQLIDIFRRYTKQVGYAGLKDKHATTIQYLTFDSRDLAVIKDIKHPAIEILEVFKSKRMLRVGDLLANRFRLWLAGARKERVEVCMEHLMREGVPNYFGQQRFSREGIERAKAFVEGELFAQGRVAKMLISSYQSHLFNSWLAYRVKMGFGFMPGDVIKDGDRYTIAFKSAPKERITGLLPGSKVLRAKGEARAIEARYDEAIPARGDRRNALFFPKDVRVEQGRGGVWVEFVLPKGSYATIVVENLLAKA